ncbi:MAG TPA: EAL domain-containing protein [Arenimonas sp.]|nr:EAL domain-containing protein [Arenimonas sp.]
MPSLAVALRLLAFGLLYVAGDLLGEHLLLGPDQITLVWMPAGIAFAALVLYGRRYWPFIPVAEVIAQIPEPANFVTVTVIANTVAALAGAWTVQRLADVDDERFVTRSGFVLVVGAAVLAAVSAVIGVSGLVGIGLIPGELYADALLKWLVANFFGVVLVSPAVVLLAQLRRFRRADGDGEWPSRAEHWLWAALLVAALALLARADRTTSDYVLGLTSLPLALLIWSALRFSPWLTALASFAVGMGLTMLAGFGLAGFTRPESMTDAVILIGFLSVMVLVPLVLGGATNQNRLATRRLLRQARSDDLTGLPNRSGFEIAMQAHSRAHVGQPLALLYLDLDNFKLVNDNAGHAAGDTLLQQLVGLLQAEIPASAILARLGGDEFALVVADAPTAPAVELAQRLRTAIAGFRFPHGGHLFSTSTSIGLAPFVGGSDDYAHLLAQADAACFTAKELGGNRVQVASADASEVVARTEAMHWAVRLREGMEQDRFRLFCQSIAPLHQDGEHGRHFEVLLRLYDPQRDRLLPPGQFVPAAERFRMGPQLDRHVIDRTLRWLELRPEWLAEVGVCSINLCAASVEDEDFVDYLHARLKASPVPEERLCFEITETSAVRDLGEAQRFIDGVRGLGCRLALDDFGAGFCSFAYLDSLDVDYFKIDGSFVRKIESSPLSLSIVRAITDIAHNIGKRTVAEFVETDSIRARLTELGVDYAQGYALDAPMPIEDYFGKPFPRVAR